jgi:hypothetical protein
MGGWMGVRVDGVMWCGCWEKDSGSADPDASRKIDRPIRSSPIGLPCSCPPHPRSPPRWPSWSLSAPGCSSGCWRACGGAAATATGSTRQSCWPSSCRWVRGLWKDSIVSCLIGWFSFPFSHLCLYINRPRPPLRTPISCRKGPRGQPAAPGRGQRHRRPADVHQPLQEPRPAGGGGGFGILLVSPRAPVKPSRPTETAAQARPPDFQKSTNQPSACRTPRRRSMLRTSSTRCAAASCCRRTGRRSWRQRCGRMAYMLQLMEHSMLSWTACLASCTHINCTLHTLRLTYCSLATNPGCGAHVFAAQGQALVALRRHQGARLCLHAVSHSCMRHAQAAWLLVVAGGGLFVGSKPHPPHWSPPTNP